MNEWKEIFQFSRAEIFALAILLLMVLIGGGVLLYQNSTQTLPPELFFQSVDAATGQSKPNAESTARTSNPAPTQTSDTTANRKTSAAKPGALLLNINTAPAESLMMLPRVGKVIGGRIIELRQRLGRFDSVEQLVGVRGIGKKTLELIRPYVTVIGGMPDGAAIKK